MPTDYGSGQPCSGLLTRPGKGIYNDSAGAIKATAHFKPSGFPRISVTRTDPHTRPRRPQWQALPATLCFRRERPCRYPRKPAAKRPVAETGGHPPQMPRIWFGAPNSIKGPTEAVFQRQRRKITSLNGQAVNEKQSAILHRLLVALAASPRHVAVANITTAQPRFTTARNF